MLKFLTASSLLLSPAAAAIVQVAARGDTAPISLDDIEGAKAARLMKNKEDIDVQSTYHEADIKDTGGVPDELAARLVHGRGPITAKISATGSHSRYCDGAASDDCSVDFSLVAWKFAGDEGEVHGLLEEKYADGEALKVDVDCLLRKDNEAIVGGKVSAVPHRHPANEDSIVRRAYVKVVDGSGKDGDFVSKVHFDDGVTYGHCTSPGLEVKLDVEGDSVEDPKVSVCSKHGDWQKCLEKGKAEQAIQ
ncbi:hypothetical protein ACHAXT_002714 [Thalassiosira profunda]